jgi:hypothetical protein
MLLGPKFFQRMPKNFLKINHSKDFYFYFPELGIMGKDEKIGAFQKLQHLFQKWNAPWRSRHSVF